MLIVDAAATAVVVVTVDATLGNTGRGGREE